MASSLPGGLPEGSAADINMADWLAAEQRRAVRPSTPGRPSSDVDLSFRPVAGGPGPGAQAPLVPQSKPAWHARQRWVNFTRAWAVVKVSISAVSTWLTMSWIHASAGETVCAYGVVCFWWAIGPMWRKRAFGPGQQVEPELYEGIARWLWRVGTVLVLCGGALAFAR